MKKMKVWFLFFCLSIFLVSGIVEAGVADTSEIRGQAVYYGTFAPENWGYDEWFAFAQNAHSYGITHLLGTFVGGQSAFFNSSYLGNIQNYYRMQEYIDACHDAGLEAHIIAALPYAAGSRNPDTVRQIAAFWNNETQSIELAPTMAGDVTICHRKLINNYTLAINPDTGAEGTMEDVIRELVHNYPGLDGIMLDYNRYAYVCDAPYGTPGRRCVGGDHTCYCDECRAAFNEWLISQGREGVGEEWPGDFSPGYSFDWNEDKIPDLVVPPGPRFSEFREWRTINVRDFAKALRTWIKDENPDIEFSGVIWSPITGPGTYLGQDVGRWASEDIVDWVSVMCYVSDPVSGMQSCVNPAIEQFVGGTEGKAPLAPYVTAVNFTPNLNQPPSYGAQSIETIRDLQSDGWGGIWWSDLGTPAEDYWIAIRDQTTEGFFPIFSQDVSFTKLDSTVRVQWSTNNYHNGTPHPVIGRVEYNTSPLFEMVDVGTDYRHRPSHIPGTIIESTNSSASHTVDVPIPTGHSDIYFRVQSEDANRIVTSKVYYSGEEITTTTTTTSTTTTLPIRISGQLKNDTDYIQAEVIAYNPETSQVNASDTTDSSGNYNLGVWPDVYDLRFNILNFFIPNFFIKLISFGIFSDLVDVVNNFNKIENGLSFTVNITADQEMQLYSDEMPNRILKNGSMLQSVSSYSELTNNTWYYNSSEDRVYMIVNPTIQPGVWADNGSAVAIQAAVDKVAAMGGGNVYIPEGEWNFVEVGEPWMTVEIRAGVNIFGAPTERTSGLPVPDRGMNPNDQVVDWKTILIMPYDVPGNDDIGIPAWFTITGTGDPMKSSRFTDIQLRGYRYIDPNSTSMHTAIRMNNVKNFRIDHCYFRDTCAGLWIENSSGVIDHCYDINTNGIPAPYEVRTVGYGVGVLRGWRTSEWEPIEEIMGQFTDHTVFIEDCYFSKYRHNVCGNAGGHYVFRHNTIENDFGQGSLDAHECYVDNMTATRAIEVYSNNFLNRDQSWQGTGYMIQIRGGAAVIFDNYEDGSYLWCVALTCGGSLRTDPEKNWPHDIWIWNNDFNCTKGALHIYVNPECTAGIDEGEEYFLHAPHTFAYIPYQYPHPLTV